MSYQNSGLETIDPTGKPPETRLSDPEKVREVVAELSRDNDQYSKNAADVFGLFNGNTPFSASKLREAGQSWRANFSSRSGEAFLNQGLSPFWDLVSEGEHHAIIRLDALALGQQSAAVDDFSAIVTEEFERLNQADDGLDYMFQLSQFWTVLGGFGPVFFEDPFDYRANAILRPSSTLLVPRGTKSEVSKWAIAAIICDYQPHEVYEWIKNPQAAAAMGWNIKNAREAIMNAAPNDVWPNSRRHDWELYEQMIRANDIHMSAVSEVCSMANVFVREFDGAISHSIITLNDIVKGFIYHHPRKYKDWLQVVHPFYYDRGDGTHHGVKGLGIKSYSLLATNNLMECHVVDAAILSIAMHFSMTGAVSDDANVLALGPMIIHPEGRSYISGVNMGQQLDGALVVKQDLMNTLTSNAAQYRQDMYRVKGNPKTAREVDYHAENQSIIGRAQIARYLKQLDAFYAERYRRASNPNLVKDNPGGPEALAFQKRCIDRGVPKAALAKVEWVRAARTVGWGSADARRQGLNRLLALLPAVSSETGREKIIRDNIAAEVGYSNMLRYMPTTQTPGEIEQAAEATQNVASMKIGVPPMVTPSQNPAIYSGVYLQAATDALGSLAQGANPSEVYSFLQVAGPAIRQQLDRLARDPSRKELLDQYEAVYERVVSAVDQLEKQIQAQQQQQAKMAQQQQQVMSEQELEQFQAMQDEQRKTFKAQRDEQRKQAKADQQMRVKGMQARQSMAIKDATAAQGITTSAAKARTDIAIKEQKANEPSDNG